MRAVCRSSTLEVPLEVQSSNGLPAAVQDGDLLVARIVMCGDVLTPTVNRLKSAKTSNRATKTTALAIVQTFLKGERVLRQGENESVAARFRY